MTDDGGGGMTSLGNDEFDNSVGKMKEKPSPFIPSSEQKQEPKIGPNGETINFQRGGTPIQENVPKAPSGENTVGKSPLHNRATLRSRRGDPATEAGPRAELARWFSRIGIMVGAPDNWRREFSGGFLIAQCLEIYFPRAIQSKGFHTGSSTQYKRDNWRQLQQFFLKFNHPLDDSDIKDLLNAKKGKIVPFLLKVHFFISSQGWPWEPLELIKLGGVLFCWIDWGSRGVGVGGVEIHGFTTGPLKNPSDPHLHGPQGPPW